MTRIEKLVEKQNGKCIYCGVEFDVMNLPELEHFIPQSFCSIKSKTVLYAACRRCNSNKSFYKFSTVSEVREFLTDKGIDCSQVNEVFEPVPLVANEPVKTRRCEFCDVRFVPKTYANSRQRWCSEWCQSRANAKAKKLRRENTGRVVKACQNCAIPFVPTLKDGRFCSCQCAYKANGFGA